MQGSSRGSLAGSQERLESLLGVAGSDGESLGRGLFSVVDLLDANASLRRALTDPSHDGASKAALVAQLLTGKVPSDVLDVVSGVVRERWSRGRDLPDALDQLAVHAVLAGAQSAGRLDRVEDELFRFERLVAADRQLAQALGDRAAPAQSKVALLDTLLATRAAPETRTLVRRAVVAGRGLHLADALEGYIELAAVRRERLVASVRVAVPLDDAQRQRLTTALGRLYGKPVHLNVDLDPSVLGGIRVEIGDEVLDGTIVRRLDDVRRRLAS